MTSRQPPTPDEIHIKHAANGGFIVRHSYDNSNAGPSYMPPKEHAFTSHKEAAGHVMKHMSKMGGAAKLGDRDGDESPSTPTLKGALPAGLKKPPTKTQGRAAARKAGAGAMD